MGGRTSLSPQQPIGDSKMKEIDLRYKRGEISSSIVIKHSVNYFIDENNLSEKEKVVEKERVRAGIMDFFAKVMTDMDMQP